MAPSAPSEARSSSRANSCGAGAKERCRELLIRRPDDRARAVDERQERERAGAQEALPGGALVRPLGRDRGDDRDLAIVGNRRGETRRRAQRRARAIRADHEARRQRRAAGFRCARARLRFSGIRIRSA